jgi:parvulin-like peptidyl-prolyl isomerase
MSNAVRPHWLILGMAVGLAAVLVGMRPAADDAEEGLAARVNDVGISQPVVDDRISSGRSADTVLRQLIDEELLVQRGLALGLAEHNLEVRRALINGVSRIVLAEERTSTYSDEELQAHFNANPGIYIQPAALKVRRIVFDGRKISTDEAQLRAEKARAEMISQGTAFTSLADTYGDEDVYPPPDGLVAPSELAGYLGRTLMQAILDLEVGQISEPIVVGDNVYLIQLVELVSGPEPVFEELRDQVERAYRRTRSRESLEAYVTWLRRDADVTVY